MMRESAKTGSESLDVQGVSVPQEDDLRSFLIQAMVENRMSFGDRLPTERELASRFQLTRAAVRRVLLDLERDGRIYRKVGRGTFVSEGSGHAPWSAENWRDIGPKELMEARLAVEPELVRLFVENASSLNEDRLQMCLTRSEAARGFEEFEQWDEALHEAIAEGTRNVLLTEWYVLITKVRKQSRWYGIKRRVYTGDYRSEIERQHRTLVSALIERNEERAVEAARHHLVFIRSGLFGP